MLVVGGVHRKPAGRGGLGLLGVGLHQGQVDAVPGHHLLGPRGQGLGLLRELRGLGLGEQGAYPLQPSLVDRERGARPGAEVPRGRPQTAHRGQGAQQGQQPQHHLDDLETHQPVFGSQVLQERLARPPGRVHAQGAHLFVPAGVDRGRGVALQVLDDDVGADGRGQGAGLTSYVANGLGGLPAARPGVGDPEQQGVEERARRRPGPVGVLRVGQARHGQVDTGALLPAHQGVDRLGGHLHGGVRGSGAVPFHARSSVAAPAAFPAHGGSLPGRRVVRSRRTILPAGAGPLRGQGSRRRPRPVRDGRPPDPPGGGSPLRAGGGRRARWSTHG